MWKCWEVFFFQRREKCALFHYTTHSSRILCTQPVISQFDSDLLEIFFLSSKKTSLIASQNYDFWDIHLLFLNLLNFFHENKKKIRSLSRSENFLQIFFTK